MSFGSQDPQGTWVSMPENADWVLSGSHAEQCLSALIPGPSFCQATSPTPAVYFTNV